MPDSLTPEMKKWFEEHAPDSSYQPPPVTPQPVQPSPPIPYAYEEPGTEGGQWESSSPAASYEATSGHPYDPTMPPATQDLYDVPITNYRGPQDGAQQYPTDWVEDTHASNPAPPIPVPPWANQGPGPAAPQPQQSSGPPANGTVLQPPSNLEQQSPAPSPPVQSQETPTGQVGGGERVPTGVTPTEVKVNGSRMLPVVGDRPLDALAKLHAQYRAGTNITNPQELAKQATTLVGPLAQVLAKNGAGSDAMLTDIARLAWYRQTGGKSGNPEAAPQDYISSWKSAYRAGQPVEMAADLDKQLMQNRIDPLTVKKSLGRPEMPARSGVIQPVQGQFSNGHVTGFGPQGQFSVPDALKNLPGPEQGVGWKRNFVEKASATLGIDPRIAMRVMNQESGAYAGAVSPKGARGEMQLMPDTARYLQQKYGVDPRTSQGNMLGGLLYFREQLAKFGSYSSALAAYNAGPGAVEKYGGVPPYAETQRYVKSILGR